MSTIQKLPRVIPDLGEKMVGLTKEFWGTLLSRDDLRREGQAQQQKATERLEQFERELKADAKRGQAELHERDQMRHQSPERRGGGKPERAKTGPEAGASSTGEKVKGSVKEAAGSLLGNEDMRREGMAQQDKAAAEKDVAKEEGKAEKARAKAAAAEREEKAASSG